MKLCLWMNLYLWLKACHEVILNRWWILYLWNNTVNLEIYKSISLIFFLHCCNKYQVVLSNKMWGTWFTFQISKIIFFPQTKEHQNRTQNYGSIRIWHIVVTAVHFYCFHRNFHPVNLTKCIYLCGPYWRKSNWLARNNYVANPKSIDRALSMSWQASAFIFSSG